MLERPQTHDLLEEGQIITSDMIEPWVGPLLPLGNCYQNAATIVLHDPDSHFLYCEGYALSGATGSFPYEHAWLFNRQTGKFTCPTWGEKFVCGFGSGFHSSWLRLWTLGIRHYGIYCNQYMDRDMKLWDQGYGMIKVSDLSDYINEEEN